MKSAARTAMPMTVRTLRVVNQGMPLHRHPLANLEASLDASQLVLLGESSGLALAAELHEHDADRAANQEEDHEPSGFSTATRASPCRSSSASRSLHKIFAVPRSPHSLPHELSMSAASSVTRSPMMTQQCPPAT